MSSGGSGSSRTILLGLLPVALPYLLVFSLGIGYALLQSLGYLLPPPVEPLGLAAYRELFSDFWFLGSFLHSLRVGGIATALSLFFGTLLALLLWRMTARERLAATVYKIPLILPHLVVAFLVLILFDQSGIISSLACHLGLIETRDQFPDLIWSAGGTGLILAYIIKETPFVTLMVFSMLTRIDPRMIQTGRMLGCRGPELFFGLVLPEIAPVLNTVFIILFLYSFGGVDIPMVIGGSRPEMVSIFIFNEYFRRDLTRRPYAMAALVLVLLFSLLFIVLYSWIVRKRSVNVRKI